MKKNKKVTAWGLVSKDGTFIAAFRFRPKRVYQGEKGKGYYAWTDCNGPKRHPDVPNYAANVIEGSMNARCVRVQVQVEDKKLKASDHFY
jgi:hypothetical protein